jgi:type 2 lantibiotic biosynthesis protein LanM
VVLQLGVHHRLQLPLLTASPPGCRPRRQPGIPWERALRLGERQGSPGEPPPAAGAADFDAELARRRLERWRAQSPFTDPLLLERRLRAAGLSERRMLRLLGESDGALRRRSRRPGWVRELAAGLRHEARELPAGAAEGRDDPLRVFAPLIAHAVDELARRGAALARGANAAAVDVAAFARDHGALLARQLRTRVLRVLAVELRIASLEGKLAGEGPEERFRAFLDACSGAERRGELLARYPVLGRMLATAIRHWLDFGLELLAHAVHDREAIAELFAGGADPGPLCGTDAETGDLHRGGRCVVIARFASGLRVVYKPKPLAVDRHFQELLAWLNDRGADPAFRTLRILDRGEHGWEEHVAAAPCTAAAEVERFYRRIGGYLALLYLVDATDLHLENLIAAGEHPMLVDLESLFHARAQRQFPLRKGVPLEPSVLRTGLLPQRRQAASGAQAPDISGLFGAAGQLSAEPLPHWVDAGTDGMRLARDPLRMPGGSNQPSLAGAEVDLLDYGPAIVAGLRHVYGLLLDHRAELLAADGPLAAFAGDPVRVLLRPTMIYAKLLTEGTHPHVLGNALELERHFDRLWVAAEQTLLDAVIPSEQDDLWEGDVPLFTSRPSSRDLWDSRGRRIPDFWDAPSLEVVLDRVRGLSPEDLLRQTWFVRASLATRVANAHRSRLPSYELAADAPAARREDLLAAALEIGARLELLAVQSDGEAHWWGLELLASGWSLADLQWDLYGGLLGIALFLAYLGELAGERRYRALAEATTLAARRLLAKQARDDRAPPAAIGAFDGLGGAIYALCHLARLWRQPELLAEAEELAALVCGRVERDQAFDVMSGSAGALAALLVLHGEAPDAGALGAAAACGERLLAGATRLAVGIGWPKRKNEPPLTGFSHGAAGIAWALARLGAATGDERYRAAARDAIAYERSLAMDEIGNWRDLRRLEPAPGQPAAEPVPMWAWCHGAPGIGLARLATRPWLDDPAIDREIDTALASTLRRGFGMNHSLCHGDLGNLEFLLHARRRPRGARLQPHIDRLAAQALAGIRRQGCLCGVPEGLETPGLMTGLAGIGYGLLRLADPDRVPAVLILEPPRSGPSGPYSHRSRSAAATASRSGAGV